MRLFGRRVRITMIRPPGDVFFHRGFYASVLRANDKATGKNTGQHSRKVEPEGNNAVIITDMRVAFSVEKSLGKEPNKAEIVISNLAAETRAAFQRKPLTVQVEAGYDDDFRHLFSGDLRNAKPERSPPDIDLKMELGDGSRAFAHARVNRSYTKGAGIEVALRDVARSMGLELPENLKGSLDLRRQFATGATLSGPSREELTRLLAPYGYSWSIQDGRLQIIRDDQWRNDEAMLVSENDGMVGSPVFGAPQQKGKAPKLTVTTLLRPEATPGARVMVKSRDVNGIFRLEKVTHTGDTHGEEWTSEMEMKQL